MQTLGKITRVIRQRTKLSVPRSGEKNKDTPRKSNFCYKECLAYLLHFTLLQK